MARRRFFLEKQTINFLSIRENEKKKFFFLVEKVRFSWSTKPKTQHKYSSEPSSRARRQWTRYKYLNCTIHFYIDFVDTHSSRFWFGGQKITHSNREKIIEHEKSDKVKQHMFAFVSLWCKLNYLNCSVYSCFSAKRRTAANCFFFLLVYLFRVASYQC